MPVRRISSRVFRAGVIACAIVSPAAAAAQTPPPLAATPSGDEARIEALERELRQVETELGELKAARRAAAPAGSAASSPATTETAAATQGPTSAASAMNPGAPSTDVAQGGGRRDGHNDGAIPAGTPTSAATASIIGGHPVIQTADGRFTATLLGVMQFDAAIYDQSTPGPVGSDLRRGAAATDTAHARDLSSGSDFRRARIGIGGRAFGDFEYDILYEFGGAGEEDAGHIQELWAQYSGLKPFHLRVGAFAPFIGLEDAGSTNGMPFLERPTSSDVARSLAGGDYREGGQLVANTDRWFASAAVTGRLVGVVNSTASGVAQPYDSQLSWVGRAAVVALRGPDYLVHVGVHGSFVEHPADAGGPDAAAGAARYPIELRERPELRVDGTRLIDTGAIDAEHAHTVGAEFAGVWRSLFLQGEYDHVGIQRRNSVLSNPDFPGWYVEGTWLLTGEQRRYNTGNFAFDGPPIRHNFSLRDGGWGAFELGVRYSDEDLNHHEGKPGSAPAPDAVRGGEQKIFTSGLNWYLNPIVRLMFEYQRVEIDRLSPNAVTFLTPTGAGIGQGYNVFAMRSQLAF